MKILIIGDNPQKIGGVPNYTRPLAHELSKNNNVYYLCNSASLRNYDLAGERILEYYNNEKTFKIFELINGRALVKNYFNLELDTSNWFDEFFVSILKEVKPDVIDIHEIPAFSSNIIKVAKRQKIPVVVTVHEYWWLCPHRVMVDHEGKNCNGPSDINKCADCVLHQTKNSESIKTFQNKQRLKKYLPFIAKYLVIIKKYYSAFKIKKVDIKFKQYESKAKLKSDLQKRLELNINQLNNSSLVIAVSHDVKNHLERFGVNKDKILVQHIGSEIAQKQRKLILENNMNHRIRIGFVGGVTYYKGVHLLVDAYMRLDDESKYKSELHIYGKSYNDYMEHLLDLAKNSKNINFHGYYNHIKDLEIILSELDLMVLPSLVADTAPQTIFEAFWAKLPIVAPNIGGFPDFVMDNVNGRIFEANNVESLRQVLESIIQNEHLIETYKSNVPVLKTIKNNVNELLQVYSNIINNYGINNDE